jgi:deazaflavin-dependent oxidoreductase (nitroreductase family)
VSKADVVQQRWLGTSLSSLFWRTPILVLHTTGRRSGLRRSTPVAYKRLDDGSYLIIGGAAGQTRIPDWVANLRTNPRAEVVVRKRREDVVAEELQGDERARAWADARQGWPQIDDYERAAGRQVPVFRLRRSGL